MAYPEIECRPDVEDVCRRMAAWWEQAVVDRACIQVSAPRPGRVRPPEPAFASIRERWLAVEFNVDRVIDHVRNTYYAGEALPIYFPNLGPEVLSTAYGAELEFGDHTSWSIPVVHDWSTVAELRFDPSGLYWSTIMAMTRYALEAGRGEMLVGHTDLHPGADLAASLREPQQLAADCALEPEHVKELMSTLFDAFFRAYELQYTEMLAAGQTYTTSWLPAWCEGRYYIPSSDFSCMVSGRMFAEFFLPELEAEISFLDRSVYHLDGPDAIRHLDRLFAIEKLDAIQWVPGAGALPVAGWGELLKRIQEAGKSIHIEVTPEDLNPLMDVLRPEGVMFVTSAASPEEADALVARVARWTAPGRY